MKTYKVPVVWSWAGTIEVQAENLDDAILEAENAPVPTAHELEGVEVDEVVYDIEGIMQVKNRNSRQGKSLDRFQKRYKILT